MIFLSKQITAVPIVTFSHIFLPWIWTALSLSPPYISDQARDEDKHHALWQGLTAAELKGDRIDGV